MSVTPSDPKVYPPIVMVLDVLLTHLAFRSLLVWFGGSSMFIGFGVLLDDFKQAACDRFWCGDLLTYVVAASVLPGGL